MRKKLLTCAPIAAGGALGVMFVTAAATVLFGNPPEPEFPKDSPVFHFMAAFGPTGYLKFVKVLELAGGILVAIPRTRNVGLLVLGPIIVNIVAFHVFITSGANLFSPMLIAIVVLALYLLWVERRKFAGLLN